MANFNSHQDIFQWLYCFVVNLLRLQSIIFKLSLHFVCIRIWWEDQTKVKINIENPFLNAFSLSLLPQGSLSGKERWMEKKFQDSLIQRSTIQESSSSYSSRKKTLFSFMFLCLNASHGIWVKYYSSVKRQWMMEKPSQPFNRHRS